MTDREATRALAEALHRKDCIPGEYDNHDVANPDAPCRVDAAAILAAEPRLTLSGERGWHGGPPLVPAWCIDHAETEVQWNSHHIPVAARPAGVEAGLRLDESGCQWWAQCGRPVGHPGHHVHGAFRAALGDSHE